MSSPHGSQPTQPRSLNPDIYRCIATLFRDVVAAHARREDLSGSQFTLHEARTTLMNLTLASRDLNAVAQPLLYTHIELRTSASLNILLSRLTQNQNLALMVRTLDVSGGITWNHHHNWPHPPAIVAHREPSALPLPGMQTDLRRLWAGVYRKMPATAERWNRQFPNTRDGVLNLVLLLLMLPNLQIFRSLPAGRNDKCDWMFSTLVATMPKDYASRLLRNLNHLDLTDLKCRNWAVFFRQMVHLPRLRTLHLPLCRGLRLCRLTGNFLDQHSLPLQNVRIQSNTFVLDYLSRLLRAIQRLEVLHYPATECIRRQLDAETLRQAIYSHRQYLTELNLLVDYHRTDRREPVYLYSILFFQPLNPPWSFASYSRLRSLHISDVCLGFKSSQELQRTDLTACLPQGIETFTLMTRVGDYDSVGYVWELSRQSLSFRCIKHISLLHMRQTSYRVSHVPTISQRFEHGHVVFQYIRYF